jgi:hypothetical protein
VLSIGDSLFRFERAHAEPDAAMTWIEFKTDSEPPPPALSVQLQDTSASRLAVQTPTKTWEVELKRDELTIGRDLDNDVVIDFPAVSRRHAVLHRDGDRFMIRDLQSGNGTYVRSQRIAVAPLLSGDSFRVGPAELVFEEGFSFDALTVFESKRSATSKGGRSWLFPALADQACGAEANRSGQFRVRCSSIPACCASKSNLNPGAS